MSDPSFVPLNLGDTHDDDGQVIDSLVMAESEPPTPTVGPIVTPSLPLPSVPTRLLSVRQSVDPLWSGLTQLLPEDTRRKHLTVSVTSPAATTTDGVVIRSDNGPVTGLGLVTHGKTVPLDGHTGAVWVAAVGAAAVLVDVWSVTE